MALVFALMANFNYSITEVIFVEHIFCNTSSVLNPW